MASDRTLTVIFAGDASGAVAATQRVEATTGTLGQKVAAAGKKLTSAGKSLTLGLTLPLVGVGIAAVKTAGEFEKTMNTMGAVAGVPGPELEKLSDLAIKMGQDTVFSANEAGEAMLELGKAGISTADIMGGALANTLDLATAGDLQLADAATVAANAMNVFGLSGKDSKQAVDALAGAANASSADVSDLAMALAQGGNAAASAGLTIQETTAALAAFADAGMKGSDAGTSLKTFLLNLVPTSIKAKEAMSDLGMSFVDNQGNIKPLSAIAQELQDKLGGLTQAQQQVALKTIFGTDAYRAANIIMKEGADGLAKYIDDTSKSGAAAEVAASKMKGWAGTFESLKGSLETMALSIGQILIPVLTQVAQFLAGVANAFSDLPDSMQGFIVAGAAVLAIIGPLMVVIGTLVTAITAIGLPVLAVVAAIGLLVAAFVIAYKESETFRNIIHSVIDFFTGTVVPAFQEAASFIAAVWADLVAWTQDHWDQISEAVTHVVNAVQAVIENVITVVKAVWQAWGDELVNIAKVVWGLIRNAIETAIKVIQGVIEFVLAVINGDWGEAWNAIKKIVGAVWDGIMTLIEGALKIVGQLIEAGLSQAKLILSTAWNAIKKVAGEAWDAFVGILKTAWEQAKKAVSEGISLIRKLFTELPGKILDWLGDLAKLLFEAGKDIIRGLINGMKSMIGEAVDTVSEIGHDIKGAVTSGFGLFSPSRVFRQYGQWLMEGLALGITDKQAAVLERLSDVTAAITSTLDDLRGAVSALADFEAPKRFAAKMHEAMQLAARAVRIMFDEIGNLAAGLSNAEVNQVTRFSDAMDAVAGVVGSVADTVTALTEIAGASMPNIADAVRNAMDIAVRVVRITINAFDDLGKRFKKSAQEAIEAVTALIDALNKLFSLQGAAPISVGIPGGVGGEGAAGGTYDVALGGTTLTLPLPPGAIPYGGTYITPGYGPNPPTVNVTVEGSVITERELADTIREQLLQLGRRNLSVGLS